MEETEIWAVIKNMNNNKKKKASGPDGFPVEWRRQTHTINTQIECSFMQKGLHPH